MVDLKSRILAELKKGRATTAALSSRFGVSRQAVHKHLSALVSEGFLLKVGTSKKTTSYLLASSAAAKSVRGNATAFHHVYDLKGLAEDRVWRDIAALPALNSRLTDEARDILRYAFTEMLNNAIDHSDSRKADVSLVSDALKTSFIISDKGIGVFESIRKGKKLASELEAVQDLLKGKQTTAPERHSGEGIFFTSKAVDVFSLESHRKKLLVDNRLPDLFLEDIRPLKGTTVRFEIDNKTKKKLDELFRQYSGENFEFDKTRVTVKLFEEGETYVSRSQAKRLLHGLERFKTIVLDFQEVPSVGQGFADEIFRVYARERPETTIVPVNAGENVNFMIQRAKQPP